MLTNIGIMVDIHPHLSFLFFTLRSIIFAISCQLKKKIKKKIMFYLRKTIGRAFWQWFMVNACCQSISPFKIIIKPKKQTKNICFAQFTVTRSMRKRATNKRWRWGHQRSAPKIPAPEEPCWWQRKKPDLAAELLYFPRG